MSDNEITYHSDSEINYGEEGNSEEMHDISERYLYGYNPQEIERIRNEFDENYARSMQFVIVGALALYFSLLTFLSYVKMH